MNYTAITIGPIIKTLSLARKPRELWSASYLFSYLMECIIDKIPKQNNILSPAVLTDNTVPVGLYPDRVFVKDMKLSESKVIIKEALKTFSIVTGLVKSTDNYFNLMSISVEAESDSEAIHTLNKKLDVIELCCFPTQDSSNQEVLQLIMMKKNSPLFNKAMGVNIFPIEMLAEIASSELSAIDFPNWKEARDFFVSIERLTAYDKENLGIRNDEDYFYQLLKEKCHNKYKSYHKYVCVVQADGDNMGQIVSLCPQGQLSGLSDALMSFGKSACKIIKENGGLPIYAGGDDLLFIAPVVGKDNQHIFNLVNQLDEKYKIVRNIVDKCNIIDNQKKQISTSMSYGVFISYYKFPLYEALGNARALLFADAKHTNGKNAIAWRLQKHSGSSFYSKCSKSDDVYNLFETLIATTTSEKLVAAVAHKIRSDEELLSLWMNKDIRHINLRLDSFYKKYLEHECKSAIEQDYLVATKNLLVKLYATKDMGEIIKNMFSMLRTAKFIQGEEDNHE